MNLFSFFVKSSLSTGLDALLKHKSKIVTLNTVDERCEYDKAENTDCHPLLIEQNKFAIGNMGKYGVAEYVCDAKDVYKSLAELLNSDLSIINPYGSMSFNILLANKETEVICLDAYGDEDDFFLPNGLVGLCFIVMGRIYTVDIFRDHESGEIEMVWSLSDEEIETDHLSYAKGKRSFYNQREEKSVSLRFNGTKEENAKFPDSRIHKEAENWNSAPRHLYAMTQMTI